MIIKRVDNKEDAIECDKLLTKLVNNERNYDRNISKDYVVNGYFENIYANENNCLFIVKDENNTTIGYAFCKIITSDNGPYINHIALVDGLYVNEEYRNQGIATKLIEECKTWAINTGARILEINVMTGNINAINLYEKIGFKELEKKMRLEL